MSRRWSIRAQLLALVLAVGLPLAALLAYSIDAARRDAERKARESSLALARVTSAGIEQLLADSERMLATFARRPLVRAVDPARCDPELREFAAFHPEYSTVVVIDPSGRVVCSAVPQSGVSVAEAEWFRKVMRTAAFTVSKPFVGPITGKRVSALAYPIRDEGGRLAGALALGLDLVRLQPSVGVRALPAGAVITVVDAEGVVVARSR